MSGIVAYAGTRADASTVILESLRGLGQRGYDSWGIAVPQRGLAVVEKSVGILPGSRVQLPSASVGVGHTRWATHGSISKANAHPHIDCTGRWAVIHNGIIDNFERLRDDLQRRGHTFNSETDTEVIPHIVEEACVDLPVEFRRLADRIVSVLMRYLMGASSIVIMDSLSGCLLAATTGLPLAIAQGNGVHFIASDPNVLQPYAKKLSFLEAGRAAILGQTGVNLLSGTKSCVAPALSNYLRLHIEAPRRPVEHR